MLESLVTYTVQAFRTTAAAWAERYPHPALVVHPFQVGAGGFGTMSTQEPSDGTEKSLAWITKREGANAFDMMVTIGRAQNNDITIPAQDVSKFHAYVRFEDGGSATLTDAGSTLGTFLGEHKLTPREEKVPLSDGTQLRLGTVRATFFTPAGLHAFLLSDAE